MEGLRARPRRSGGNINERDRYHTTGRSPLANGDMGHTSSPFHETLPPLTVKG